jgi:enoyl-CoA hydratase/carnithine racemase
MADEGPTFAELKAMSADGFDRAVSEFQEAFRWLGRPDLVSVAQIQGYALGGGLHLALACHVRFMATDAELAFPEVTLGIVPDLGGLGAFVDALGRSAALEALLTSRRIGADEALRTGLVTRVVETSQLALDVDAFAATVADLPRDLANEIVALVWSSPDLGAAAQRAAQRAAQARLLHSGEQD